MMMSHKGMKLPRVNPNSQRGRPLRLAILNNFDRVAEALLQNERVNPGIDGNSAVRLASEFNRERILQLLLNHPDVNASALKNSALRIATQMGNTAIVERLLKEPLVLKSNLASSLSVSKKYKHQDISSMLQDAIRQQRQLRIRAMKEYLFPGSI